MIDFSLTKTYAFYEMTMILIVLFLKQTFRVAFETIQTNNL